MRDAEFRLMDSIEENHWWFVGKRLLLRSLLGAGRSGRFMLDLGCGTGGILRDWSDECPCAGVDRSRLALRICASHGFRTLVQADLLRLPFEPGSFDTVVMMDVIEHLDDDVGFLRQAAQLCEPGGRVVVSVPAFQFLWSRHDETFQHKRRYSAGQLRRVMIEAGLQPLRTTYTHSLLFPVAALWRPFSRFALGRHAPEHDFVPLPTWLNALLVRIYRVEAWMLKRMDLPLGVSVAVIAQRPVHDGK